MCPAAPGHGNTSAMAVSKGRGRAESRRSLHIRVPRDEYCRLPRGEIHGRFPLVPPERTEGRRPSCQPRGRAHGGAQERVGQGQAQMPSAQPCPFLSAPLPLSAHNTNHTQFSQGGNRAVFMKAHVSAGDGSFAVVGWISISPLMKGGEQSAERCRAQVLSLCAGVCAPPPQHH